MNTIKLKRLYKFLIVFAASYFICVLVTGFYIHNKTQMEHAQMEQLVLTKTNKINNVISSLLYKTEVLSALVVQNNGEIQNFERVASTIIDNPSIKNVILAPDGIVTHVYPLEGNEEIIGFDYFSDMEGNKEALLARDTGRLVLGGPFNLVQGGQALVGRLPVYITTNGVREFWGLASVTLKYPQALDNAELEQLRIQGFAFEIWRISPDTNEHQIIAHSNYTYNPKASYVENPMHLLNADWYFRLSPIRKWYQHPETWLFLSFGLIISFLVALLVIHNFDLRQVKTEMEDLSYRDSLTGAFNRRFMFKTLEEIISNPNQKFILCYLDLNKFKHINDTYGHTAGDYILQQFVELFQRHINSNHLFFRIGGDEFVLVFKGLDKTENINPFLDKVNSQLNKIKLYDAPDLEVSYSIGMALYPNDGHTIDDLMIIADREMYKAKGFQ